MIKKKKYIYKWKLKKEKTALQNSFFWMCIPLTRKASWNSCKKRELDETHCNHPSVGMELQGEKLILHAFNTKHLSQRSMLFQWVHSLLASRLLVFAIISTTYPSEVFHLKFVVVQRSLDPCSVLYCCQRAKPLAAFWSPWGKNVYLFLAGTHKNQQPQKNQLY